MVFAPRLLPANHAADDTATFWRNRAERIDEMLALGADDWKLLEHAYGPAEDIPRLLEQLAEDPRPKSHYEEEPWFTLWSSLCHQGDVYTASYAAVPHLVGICLSSDGPVDLGFFQLPACVEIAHATGFGPAMPSQLVDDYKTR